MIPVDDTSQGDWRYFDRIMRWKALTNADRKVLGEAMAEVAKQQHAPNGLSELHLMLADTLDVLAGKRRWPCGRRTLATRLRANTSPIGAVIYKVGEDVT